SKLLTARNREPGVDRVVLKGPGEDDLAELTGSDPDVVRDVQRESYGNRFFATELARHLAESAGTGLPSSVSAVVRQRVRRVRAHRAVAEAIEGLGLAEARVQELARHWSAAGDAERAIEYAVRAGDEAAAGRAPAEAAAAYAQALSLLAQQPTPDETMRCEL